MKDFLKKINMLDEYVAAVFFVVMATSVFIQMVMRIFLNNAPLITEEIARFSYIWIVFLCLSIGEKRSEHFNVDVFLKFLKGIPNKCVELLTSLVILGTYVFLFFYSISFVEFQSIIVSAAMEIPMTVVALALVVGFFLAIIRCSVKACIIVQDIILIIKKDGRNA